MSYNNKNKQLLIGKVCDIVREHYEPGNQSKCYKAVWRRHVVEQYPMSYNTFLAYINSEYGLRKEPPRGDRGRPEG